MNWILACSFSVLPILTVYKEYRSRRTSSIFYIDYLSLQGSSTYSADSLDKVHTVFLSAALCTLLEAFVVAGSFCFDQLISLHVG